MIERHNKNEVENTTQAGFQDVVLWVRYFALQCLKLKTREERRNYIETQVPAMDRAAVKIHVERAFIAKKYRAYDDV